jgi:hypothetical protein
VGVPNNTTMTKRNDKAILINARENTVEFVTITDYKDISKFGKFDLFTCVQMDERGNTMYVDDEGLLNGTNVGFVVKGFDQPLMGNAVILGTNLRTGDSKDTDLTLEQVSEMVQCFIRFGRNFIEAPTSPEVVA